MKKKVEGLVGISLNELENVLGLDVDDDLKERIGKVGGVYKFWESGRGVIDGVELNDEYEDDEKGDEYMKEFYMESYGEGNKSFGVCYGEDDGCIFVKIVV